MIFVGNDWAQDHHDVWIMDRDGDKLASRRLPEGDGGLARLHELVAGFVDDPGEVIVGVEKDHGLWVTAMVAAGYRVYAINPKVASRYRDRHHVSGAKSDTADARMLADLVRTDRHQHPMIAEDSDLAKELQVLARAQQDLVWEQTRQLNKLRSALLEYYPAALPLLDDDQFMRRDMIAVLGKAPSPETGRKLSLSQLEAVLKRAGRQRYVHATAVKVQDVLRTPGHLQASPALVRAYSAKVTGIVALLATIADQLKELTAQVEESFEQHPDAEIYLSLPGMGRVLGARVLAEFGDDPERYRDAKSRKNYAGTSPITVASGHSSRVKARHIRNRHLIDPLDRLAMAALSRSVGAREFYDAKRAAGYGHHAALRALANRLVGILHGCLKHRTLYDENLAWGHRMTLAA